MRWQWLYIIGFFLFATGCTSCKTVDIVKSLYAEEAELVYFSNDSKSVYFIPMHHIGKKAFYDHVKEMVIDFKKNGYIVYYEFARMDIIPDSTTQDIYNRKFRKMMGVHLDTTGYSTLLHSRGLFKNLIDQPPYSELGLDENDKRVDISKNKIVDVYERKFGVVELEEQDKTIALTDNYPIHLRLPQKQFLDIIIDYRNDYLAKNIHSSEDKNIVVIYGAMHVGGTFDILKNMDSRWRMKKLK